MALIMLAAFGPMLLARWEHRSEIKNLRNHFNETRDESNKYPQ